MSKSGSYDLHNSHRDTQSEIKRLASQAQSGWVKEARTLAWLGMQDGMSILELGSGPGFTTKQLLAFLPASQITCLEVDPTLLEKAKEQLGESATDRVTFVEGSVMNMPFAEQSYDIAYARFLFQHLPDPVGAAQEILRVLKPGGKLIILDIDDEIMGIFQPRLPELYVIAEVFAQAQAARGGNRYIGRRLWKILATAGFGDLDLEIIANHSDIGGVEGFMKQLDPDRLVSLVQSGLLAQQDLDNYRRAYTAFLEAPDAYVLWYSFLVAGTKL